MATHQHYDETTLRETTLFEDLLYLMQVETHGQKGWQLPDKLKCQC